MNLQVEINSLLQCNFEGLPVVDKVGAARTLSTLYHFVVDNDLEKEYCSRETLLAAADRLYTALLMAYIGTTENVAQRTRLLLAQADLIFGLQAVPQRRRVDCFLAAATQHLSAVKAPTDERSFRQLAYLCQTFGGALPDTIQTYLDHCPEEEVVADNQPQATLKNRFSGLQSSLQQLESELQSCIWQ